MAMGCNSQGCSDVRLHPSLASAWSWHSGQVPPFRLQHRGWVVLSSTSSVGPPIGPLTLDSKLQTRPPPAALGSQHPSLASSGQALMAPHCRLPWGLPCLGVPLHHVCQPQHS